MNDDEIQDIASLEEWFYENETCWIIPYIEKKFAPCSYGYQHFLMKKNLYFCKKIIGDDELTNDRKKYILMENLLKNRRPGKICLVHGEMGGGKTGIGCFILDMFYKNRFDLLKRKTRKYLKFFFVTKSETKPQLPSWIKIVDSTNKLRNNSFALIDEGAIQLNARRAMSRENIDASMELVKLRQKGITLIILVQHEKMVDPNVRRLATVHIYKKGSDFTHTEGSNEQVDLIRNRLKARRINEAYVEVRSSGLFMNLEHELPDWWDDERVSKYMKNWKKKPEIKQEVEKHGSFSEQL
jgi:hypothetical protein